MTFRAMSYMWVDGQAFEPIGDSIDLWLAFLRDRGARTARLDVSGGTEVCRVTRDGGTDVWRPVWGGGIFTLNGAEVRDGEAPPAGARPVAGVASASERLARAVRTELAGLPAGVRRTGVERALAILASADDGEEVSDVAWPYFILPEGATRDARRLIAAACAASPQSGAVPDPAASPERGIEIVEAALEAIAAAVNAGRGAEPLE